MGEGPFNIDHPRASSTDTVVISPSAYDYGELPLNQCNEILQTFHNDIRANQLQVRTLTEEVAKWEHTLTDIFNKRDALEANKAEELQARTLHSVEHWLVKFERSAMEEINHLDQKINRLATNSANTQGVAYTQGPRLEDVRSKLDLSNSSPSELPGVKSLRELANQLERDASANRKHS